MALAGIVFDKDGTLFDFHATWSVWTQGLLDELAGGNAAMARKLGAAIGYHFAETGIAAGFAAHSPVIAATPQTIAEALLPHLPGWQTQELETLMNRRAAVATQVPAVPLRPLMEALLGRGLRLGIATNDAEASARAHLLAAGIADQFGFVAGYDSGYGAKPEPGPLLAFAQAMKLEPGRVVMVGDSAHDLVAGRRAGMRTLGVLTGPATADDLAPHADAVLPDIGDLPDWLDTQLG